MTKSIATLCFILLSFCASAQDIDPSEEKTSKLFYTELGGPGILFSANLDGRFKRVERSGFGFRVGIGFTLVEDETQTQQPGGQWTTDYKTRSVATFPVGLNYVFGKPNSANTFEVGAGVTVLSRESSILTYNDDKEGYFMGHFEFMYRKQPIDGGFSWRIGFTPLINADGDIVPFAAVGFGFAFK